jgi:hypothetical protein
MNFGLTTPPEEIAAVRSKNEFLEAPLSIKLEIILDGKVVNLVQRSLLRLL